MGETDGTVLRDGDSGRFDVVLDRTLAPDFPSGDGTELADFPVSCILRDRSFSPFCFRYAEVRLDAHATWIASAIGPLGTLSESQLSGRIAYLSVFRPAPDALVATYHPDGLRSGLLDAKYEAKGPIAVKVPRIR